MSIVLTDAVRRVGVHDPRVIEASQKVARRLFSTENGLFPGNAPERARGKPIARRRTRFQGRASGDEIVCSVSGH